MSDKQKEQGQPIPGTDTQRQPNETPEKQYADKEESKFGQYEKAQRDHGTPNKDPGHNYPHHGARVRDKGSHR